MEFLNKRQHFYNIITIIYLLVLTSHIMKKSMYLSSVFHHGGLKIRVLPHCGKVSVGGPASAASLLHSNPTSKKKNKHITSVYYLEQEAYLPSALPTKA